MPDLVRVLWFETWWTWSRPAHEPYLWTEIASHAFNFVEATAWFVFAGLVLRRWRRRRRSCLELVYASAFAAFGVSDLIEAWWLTSWLLWWKAINLVALFWLRRTILRRCYPEARIF